MEVSSHHRSVQNPVSIFCPWCVLVAPNVACRKAEGSSRQLRSLFPHVVFLQAGAVVFIVYQKQSTDRDFSVSKPGQGICGVRWRSRKSARRAVPRRVTELRRLKKKGETWISHLHLPQWDIVRPGLHQTMASIGHNTHWEGWLCTLALQASQLPLCFFRLCMHTDGCVRLLDLPALPMASQLLCTSGDSRWLCLTKCCACEHSLSLVHIPLY